MKSSKQWFSFSIIILILSGCTSNHNIITEYIPPPIIKKVDVALVLGGGGSKGIAHIGAIEVLIENNIPINLIVGSSAGSAVGALFSDSKDIAKTKEILFKAKAKKLLDFSLSGMAQIFTKPTTLFKGNAYEKFIFENMQSKNFSDLKIPLAVVTTDAKTGEKFVISSGPIAPAVRASSALPPVISPVEIYNRILFDGGIVEPVPVETAMQYNPKFIIAIDINDIPENKLPSNLFSLTYKAFWISYYKLAKMQIALADVVIQPDLSGHGLFDDHRKDELYQLGRKAALKSLPLIKRKLKKLKITQ
jgi:NTE family protein